MKTLTAIISTTLGICIIGFCVIGILRIWDIIDGDLTERLAETNGIIFLLGLFFGKYIDFVENEKQK